MLKFCSRCSLSVVFYAARDKSLMYIALSQCASWGWIDVVDLLLSDKVPRLKVNAAITKYKNETALHLAAANGRIEVVLRLLSERRIKVNAKCTGGEIFMFLREVLK